MKALYRVSNALKVFNFFLVSALVGEWKKNFQSMKFCYQGTSDILDVQLKWSPQQKGDLTQIWPKQHFSTNTQPDTKACPQHDLLGLVKHTKYALNRGATCKQQLGGLRDALQCIPEATFTVSLSEGDIHCSTSSVACKRSGCMYSSAAWPRQSSMGPRTSLSTSRVGDSPAETAAGPPVVHTR